MGEQTKRKRSARADAVAQELIVRQGLSYVDVIRRCEAEAGRLSAPYLELAHELREWLSDHS